METEIVFGNIHNNAEGGRADGGTEEAKNDGKKERTKDVTTY